jgi:acyl carrier protein
VLILSQQGLSERLIKLVSQVLGSSKSLPDPFPLEQQLSDLGVNSLKMVNLMLAIELEFDVMIPQHEITPENFHSLGAIARLLTRNLSLDHAAA